MFSIESTAVLLKSTPLVEKVPNFGVTPVTMDITLIWSFSSGTSLDPKITFARSSKVAFSRILSRNKRFCLVATDGGKVIGSVFGFDDVLTLHVSKLAVDVAYRRQGIGRLLMKELIRRSKKGRKFDFIFLHVAKKNKGAVALYRSLGFEDRNDVYRFMDM